MNKKEAAYELQKIDCNCNDCGFLIRDPEALQRSKDFHLEYQKHLFEVRRNKLKEKADEHRKNGRHEKAESVLKERAKLKFQFSYDTGLLFGKCKKFDEKPITFMPNQCQLETQECFKHRLDFLTDEERQAKFNK